MGSNIGVYVNVDGMSQNLPQNGCGFLGSYVFFKIDMLGNEISLTEEECKMIRAYVTANRQVRHVDTGVKITFFDSLEDLLVDRERQRFDDQHLN
jgi:hypothetical protein